MTSSGIEPATYQFAAQSFNQLRYCIVFVLYFIIMKRAIGTLIIYGENLRHLSLTMHAVQYRLGHMQQICYC
jgi:hypothetical protein